jgi:Fe-S oxidoreductase
LYPRMGKELPCECLHITQYLERLISEGRIRFREDVPLLVTYHDPCHLGRMSEPFVAEWEGDKLQRPASLKRSGKRGIYDAPRNVISSIPGLKLVEMERIKEYSWCCGAGGGVLEGYPDFAAWAARERVEEAMATGAGALVTACPWCERVFRDTVAETGADIAILDLTDLALKSTGVSNTARV